MEIDVFRNSGIAGNPLTNYLLEVIRLLTFPVKTIWCLIILGLANPVGLQAQESGFSLEIATAEGHFLPAVQRGLFDSFFENSLSFDDYAADFGDITGPWPGNGQTVSLVYARPLGTTPFVYRLKAGAGRSTGLFPEGIGIFRDPARLTINHVSVAAEIDLLHSYPLSQRWRTEISVTGGMIASLSHARLRSALLDVESRDKSHAPYLRVELGAEPQPGLRVFSSFKFYPEGRSFIGVGTRLQF